MALIESMTKNFAIFVTDSPNSIQFLEMCLGSMIRTKESGEITFGKLKGGKMQLFHKAKDPFLNNELKKNIFDQGSTQNIPCTISILRPKFNYTHTSEDMLRIIQHLQKISSE